MLYETCLREYPAVRTPDAEFPYDTIRSKETGGSSFTGIPGLMCENWFK
ncbi:MAG: hypothetical protein M0P01_08015 [Treponema sp.]|nr:hypothetical protein [Treponema sp.]